MAAPVSGAWAQANTVPYTGERKWGTGYNPVHEEYGEGPPLRVSGRNEGYPGEQGPSAYPDTVSTYELWGYTPEDSVSLGLTYDGRPSYNIDSPEFRGNTDDYPAWNAPLRVRRRFLAIPGGAHRFRQKLANALPNETVTEGWLNKPKGQPANARVSDPSQYEVQTSMRQRYERQVNTAATERGTDEPRTGIDSRVVGQKLKVYSGQERHYDMFPYQIEDMPRPFWIRSAGTGPEQWMDPNSMVVNTPIMREPPPDPYQGQPESTLQSDYGYTDEDHFYA